VPQLRLFPLAMTVLLASGTGCGGRGGDSGASPELRTAVASGLSLVQAPNPNDHELRLRYMAGALIWTPDPLARVEVDQTPSQVVVRLVVNERVPAPDEQVPNYATVRTTTVRLDRPVGHAEILDGSVTPPVPVPVRSTG
jgi:hypothetical protein